ncbi:hypothetical protein GLAREA_11654 [Glarea lozoyensis ATCC 20868]|uniref:Uncharacterized protein n=1 Tax=Glarea lozoyensis (strain ATCC 20868 / MF5171) TaxID=1116229 RepID=S3DEH6_GLAL2|nr:uncharacterized protein GLAREA_11654 [Glarea lozoyensis ATCC 20868]EPE25073.1 hypothetical protein GLAREA_11654 [Glarea lozoyensis ATCC 20868]
MASRIFTLLLLLTTFNSIAGWTLAAPKSQVHLQVSEPQTQHTQNDLDSTSATKLTPALTRELFEEIQHLRVDYEGYVKRYDRSMNLVVKKVNRVMERMGADGVLMNERGDVREVKKVVDGMVVKIAKDGVKENLALRLDVMRLLDLVDTVSDEMGILKGYMVDVKQKLGKLANLVENTE